MIVEQKYQDDLDDIKKQINESRIYFEPNYKSYHDNKKFVFLSSLTDEEKSKLKELMKPVLEFNVLEAYISRLRGEFSKQEPSIEVSKDFDANVSPGTEEVVEGYMRHIFQEASENGDQYEVYSDCLAAGFSVYKVFTSYVNDKSFNQVIKFKKAFDPTLCGFDPLARECHKGDGRYCFEVFPKTKDEFKADYPNINIDDIKFNRSVEGFNWAYKNKTQNILLVVDFYKKKNVQTKIVQLSDGTVMTNDEYDDFKDKWEESQHLEQMPVIVKKRNSSVVQICRYRLIENKVIEYTVTDFKYLPLVFVDGNSVMVREGNEGGSLQQFTRPYIYQAKGMQKLKNFAGQSLAAELERSMQHKIMASIESIPEANKNEYKDFQIASVLPYNAFKDNDPTVPLAPPQIIQRPATPPEFAATFGMADQTIQGILGSYDASLGINNNQLSGVAIVEGATQSNAAAMPYIVSYMNSINQVAQIILDLIPKYIITPRTIPIIKNDGQRDYRVINQPLNQNSINFQFGENDLQVKVKAGVNFAIQKSRALQQIISMMQASPLFAQFMNTQGLPILLDNMEMRGIDRLKDEVQGFMVQIKQQQAMQQQQQIQQAQQPNPLILKQQLETAKFQYQQQQDMATNQLRAAEVAVENLQAENDRLRALIDAHDKERNRLVQLAKNQTQKEGQAVELAIKAVDMSHQHRKDLVNMGLTNNQPINQIQEG
ncbi:MAG: hypothetical protein FK731_15630 [Asgard group archaeon]|nr:hypothetical protein [Asgard group archaeon]